MFLMLSNDQLKQRYKYTYPAAFKGKAFPFLRQSKTLLHSVASAERQRARKAAEKGSREREDIKVAGASNVH